MELIRIKILEDNINSNDNVHVVQISDMTICGEDIAGDEDREIYEGNYKKITCEKCIDLINFCKSIPKSKIAK